MKLYHGSKILLNKLENRQAQQGDTEVPRDELLNGIYLTPDYSFAVAMGARPNGETFLDDKKHTVSFKESNHFDPKENVYIYSFDSESIPTENIKIIDDRQYAIVGIDTLPVQHTETIEAGKLFDYYRLTDWKDPKIENNEFKIKMN